MKKFLGNYSNLTQRLFTAVVGAATVVSAVIIGPWTYFAVFLLIVGFTLYEFYNVCGLDGMVPQKAFE